MAISPGDGTDTVPSLEARLRADRDRSDALIGDLHDELAAIAESTASGPDDEHDAEGSTVAYERARVQALLAHAERARAELLAALDRAAAALPDASPVGPICQQCQAPIGTERLLALPATRICVACAARR